MSSDGTTSWWTAAECRWRLCANSETATQPAARYRGAVHRTDRWFWRPDIAARSLTPSSSLTPKLSRRCTYRWGREEVYLSPHTLLLWPLATIPPPPSSSLHAAIVWQLAPWANTRHAVSVTINYRQTQSLWPAQRKHWAMTTSTCQSGIFSVA